MSVTPNAQLHSAWHYAFSDDCRMKRLQLDIVYDTFVEAGEPLPDFSTFSGVAGTGWASSGDETV